MTLKDHVAAGELRWYVHRVYGRPARFGENRSTVIWVITPIVGGKGSKGIRVGSDMPFVSALAALNFAHKLAARTYRPREARS